MNELLAGWLDGKRERAHRMPSLISFAFLPFCFFAFLLFCFLLLSFPFPCSFFFCSELAIAAGESAAQWSEAMALCGLRPLPLQQQQQQWWRQRRQTLCRMKKMRWVKNDSMCRMRAGGWIQAIETAA